MPTKAAPSTSHNISLSGGTDQGNYMFSLNYFNQKGALTNTYLKRYTLRSNLAKAEEYLNKVRTRAADPAGWLYQYINDTSPLTGFSDKPAANYVIKAYPAGTFASKGKDFALKAIYYERGIELAMEGHRFFDLVRWGTAEQAMNGFFGYESKITTDLNGGKFVTGKNNYYPIPQFQIDMSVVSGAPVLIQNPGYN